MAKFKKGDRVRIIKKNASNATGGHCDGTDWQKPETFSGKEGIITEVDGSYKIGDNTTRDYLGRYCSAEIELISELISEPIIEPITLKVGDRFRVVKRGFREGCDEDHVVGGIIEIGDGFYKDTDGVRRPFAIWELELEDGCFNCTTEYLEPIEEVSCIITQEEVEERYTRPIKNNKQSIMIKLTSALKRALSTDKQALYKAGVINGGLELSTKGQQNYVDALFNNEGDHKKAVAEMVEMAKEAIEEEKQ